MYLQTSLPKLLPGRPPFDTSGSTDEMPGVGVKAEASTNEVRASVPTKAWSAHGARFEAPGGTSSATDCDNGILFW